MKVISPSFVIFALVAELESLKIKGPWFMIVAFAPELFPPKMSSPAFTIFAVAAELLPLKVSEASFLIVALAAELLPLKSRPEEFMMVASPAELSWLKLILLSFVIVALASPAELFSFKIDDAGVYNGRTASSTVAIEIGRPQVRNLRICGTTEVGERQASLVPDARRTGLTAVGELESCGVVYENSNTRGICHDTLAGERGLGVWKKREGPRNWSKKLPGADTHITRNLELDRRPIEDCKSADLPLPIWSQIPDVRSKPNYAVFGIDGRRITFR